MRRKHDPDIKPGILEVFCGPMKCGKSKALKARYEKLDFIKNGEIEYLVFKPACDTRSREIKEAQGGLYIEGIVINEQNPFTILNYIDDKHKLALVAIDEAQFFVKGLDIVVEKLLRININVIVDGLDTDFKGEPFGVMPYLLSMADEVTKLTARCEYEGCGGVATRSQRLIDGKPAHYNSPIILVEGSGQNEKYLAVCLGDHIVPGKP